MQLNKNINNELEVKLDIENQVSNKISTSTTCLCSGLTFTFIYLLFIGPFAICDLYYSQKDNYCIGEYSNAANVNMQTYLLVSGIIEFVLIGLIGCVFGILSIFKPTETEHYACMCFGMMTPIVIICMFLFAWNIVGAIVFWGHVYELGNCSQTTSTYIFTSLIIKFIGCTSNTTYSSNKKT